MNQEGYDNGSSGFFGRPLDAIELRVEAVLFAGRRVRARPDEQLESRRRVDFLV